LDFGQALRIVVTQTMRLSRTIRPPGYGGVLGIYVDGFACGSSEARTMRDNPPQGGSLASWTAGTDGFEQTCALPH